MKSDLRDTPYSLRSIATDLSFFLRPYSARFATASILRVISDIVWLYPAYSLAILVNYFSTYEKGDSLAYIWLVIGTLVVVAVSRHVLQNVAKHMAYTVGGKVLIDSQLKTIEHMFKVDISWHEKENTGNKLKKIVRGAESMERILRIWIANILEIVVNFVGIIIIIATFDMTVASFVLVFLVSYYTIAAWLMRRAAKVAQIVNVKEEEVHGLLFESINNIRSVKVLSMAGALILILKRESTDLFQKIRKQIYWFQVGNAAKGMWGYLSLIAIMTYIIFGITNGQYEAGFLVLFYGYFTKISTSVSELSNVTQDLVIAKYSVGRMMSVLKTPIVIDAEERSTPFPTEWKEISVHETHFSYGKNSVLEDISFKISRGEKVGIVGLSGGGKSTLFKLLLKERESDVGEMFVDDISLKDINKRSYLKHVAAVLQDTEVFNFSLKDNITLANIDEADNKELLQKALKISNVEDFLGKMPDGVDTIIGEKGVKLSGGEKQRLGLARAIFKNPDVLLLDEATSHLDIESEKKIQQSLHEFFQSVTAIVIAHRLTTIKEMDRIIVIEKGKIIEQGSFDELFKSKGRFFELWEKQKL